DRTQSLLERIHARGANGAPLKPALDRWLVVADEDGQSHVGTYRYVLPQLSIATDCKKTLVLLAGGGSELLTRRDAHAREPPRPARAHPPNHRPADPQ